MRLGVQQSCNKKLCVKQLPNCYNFFHSLSRHNLSPNKNYFQVNINSQRATKLFRIVFIKSFLPFLPLSAPKITSKAPLTLPSVTYTLIGFFLTHGFLFYVFVCFVFVRIGWFWFLFVCFLGFFVWFCFATGWNRKSWISTKHMPLASPSLKATLSPGTWQVTCSEWMSSPRKRPGSVTR